MARNNSHLKFILSSEHPQEQELHSKSRFPKSTVKTLSNFKILILFHSVDRPKNPTIRIQKVALCPASKSIIETFHFMPDALGEGLLVCGFFGLGFLFGFGFFFLLQRVYMEGGFGFTPSGKASLHAGVGPRLSPSKGRVQVGELQLTQGLTRRQLRSTPRAPARCPCLSRSPASPSGSWKSLEDFVPPASPFPGEAPGAPGWQRSSSHLLSRAAPFSFACASCKGTHRFGDKQVLNYFLAKLGMICTAA